MAGEISLAFCQDGLSNFSYSTSGLPVIPQCFQDVSLLAPSICMLFIAPIYFTVIRRSSMLPTVYVPFKGFFCLQMCLALCSFISLVVAFCAGIIGKLTVESQSISLISCISISLSLISLILYLLISESERRHFQSRSELIFFYLSLLAVSGLPRFYHLALHSVHTLFDQVELYTLGIFIGTAFLQLLFKCFSPYNQGNSLLSDKVACPELWASVPSLWTFHWLTSTIWKAFRGRIQVPEDVFCIRPDESVEPNHTLFQQMWEKSRLRVPKKPFANTSSGNLIHEVREPLLASPTLPLTDHGSNHVTIPNNVPSSESPFRSSCSSNDPSHRVASRALLRALGRAFGCRLIGAWLFLLLGTLLNYASPILLGLLLRFLNSPNAHPFEGYLIAIGMILSGLFTTLLNERGFYWCTNVGIAVRSALTSAVYRKVLRLSAEARSQYTSGTLINLFSVDVDRIMQFFMFSFHVWVAILQFILSFILLWRQLGSAAVAGIGCLVVMIPLNTLIMWITSKFEASELKWNDNRLKCLGELFASIKIIKLYAWEKAFQRKVDEIRSGELHRLAQAAVGWGVDSVMWILAPYLILLVTFLAYTWEVAFRGRVSPDSLQLLDPERIFVSLSLFNLLRAPLQLLPWSLPLVIKAYVSVKRLAAFLLSSELDNSSVFLRGPTNDPDSTFALSFVDASFSWTQNGPLVLQNINLLVPRGSLVAIVGAVGSGKSSFLSACLGELVRREGFVHTQGSVAYVPQTAWIQQQTLRENICFGETDDDCSVSVRLDGIQDKQDWYETVVAACALQQDIERLPNGDQTEIGERGVNLSGGQKQRVSLARAVYQLADIYLLDDPLSAVDSHVRQHLFTHVLGPTGLLKSKTRILVTNSFQCLPQVDWIVVLSNEGRVLQIGTYADVCEDRQGYFFNCLRTMEQQLCQSRREKTKSESAASVSNPFGSRRESKLLEPSVLRDTSDLFAPRAPSSSLQHLSSTYLDLHSSRSVSRIFTDGAHDVSECMDRIGETNYRTGVSSTLASSMQPDFDEFEKENDEELELQQQQRARFVDEEELVQGRIPWSTFIMYLRARGWILSAFTLAGYALSLGVQTFANYWLQWFADDPGIAQAVDDLRNQTILHNDTARAIAIQRITDLTYHYISGYAWAGLALTAMALLLVGTSLASSLRASKRIHHALLRHVLHAPSHFFDRTPLGRILNRFSNDIHHLDHDIPTALADIIACFGESLVALLVVVITLRPVGIGFAIAIPLVVVFTVLSFLYSPCSRQVRRLDSMTKSNLLSLFAETAASSLGASVVRAFGRTDHYVAHMNRLIDRNSVQTFLSYTSNRWLGVCLNLLTRCLLFVSVVVVINGRSIMTPGLAGLIITYAMDTADDFTWFVKHLVQLETSAISLERIRDYTLLPQEANWDIGPDSPPPSDWPAPCCQIVFNKTSVLYDPLSTTTTSADDAACKQIAALRSVDLVLSGDRSSRRIGILGRTGAGKSSLAACLFRLVEPTILEEDRSAFPDPFALHGPVLVDGVDICRIGLHELRSRFSILPQDPVLFSGSLRFNLDPFGNRPDEELLEALEAAHLSEWMQTNGITLDYECGEAGCNLSAGQRQLVCLARVFLSSGGRVRLLMLDEATAAMDPATDQVVMQTVIGDQFKDATVLIIAHRLSTVANADFIVVLDRGRVVETGAPDVLLADPNSRFSKMHHA